MKRLTTLLFAALAAILLALTPAVGGEVKFMEIDELKQMIGSDDVVVLDVRAGRDWSTSEFKIQGAMRADGADFDSWANTYPKEKKLVLYCA